MNKYLTKEQIKAELNVGNGVEQWLGYYSEDDEIILKWLRIYKEKNTYNIMYIECYDQGDVNHLDVYDFTVADPDEPYGIISSVFSVEEAIILSINEYGASNERFVKGGMIQEEYLAYLNDKL